MTAKRRTKPCGNPECDKPARERPAESESKWKERKFCTKACGLAARQLKSDGPGQKCGNTTCKKFGETLPLYEFSINKKTNRPNKICKKCQANNRPITRADQMKCFELIANGVKVVDLPAIMGRSSGTINLMLRDGPVYDYPQFMYLVEFQAERLRAKHKRNEAAKLRRAEMRLAA